MTIDLFDISEPIYKFQTKLAPAEINLNEESAQLVKPTTIAGNVKKGIAQVDVEGDIVAEIEIDCTRCLAKTQSKLDFPFKVTYVTEENYTATEDAELRADDLEISVFDGEKIDLNELAREQILLNLPNRFLCGDSCKGLCAKCGANRNQTNCGCEEKEFDPRWQGLRDLKN